MQVKDLANFEEQMKLARGVKRGELCRLLGISQAKWRRHIEGRLPEDVVLDRTLGLAMAAVWAGLDTYGAVQFTRLNSQDYPASGSVQARRMNIVHFVTWPAGG